MPLQFANSAAQSFFWIFCVLFVGAVVTALVFCYRGKNTPAALCRAGALAALGSMMVCLVPTAPLLYFSCFFMALYALGELKDAWTVRCVAFAVFAAAQIFNVVTMAKLLSFQIPVYAYILLGLLVVGIGVGTFLLPKRRPLKTVFQVERIVLSTLAAIFALILIIDNLLYSTIFLMFGYALYAGEAFFPEREGTRRAYYKTIFYALGQGLIYVGLALSIVAI